MSLSNSVSHLIANDTAVLACGPAYSTVKPQAGFFFFFFFSNAGVGDTFS